MSKRLLFKASRIDHAEQRYPTCGDWIAQPDGSCHITVSRLPDPRYELLVAIHELCEATLCAHRGILQSAVDAFDKRFEAERAQGQHGDEEPGDDPAAPYYREHQIATAIEKQMAHWLDVDWSEYEKAINEL
jgi:hypothetical protein